MSKSKDPHNQQPEYHGYSEDLSIHHPDIAAQIEELRDIYRSETIDDVSKHYSEMHYSASRSNKDSTLLNIYHEYFYFFFSHLLQGMPNHPEIPLRQYNQFRNKGYDLDPKVKFELSAVIGFSASRILISSSTIKSFLEAIGMHHSSDVDSVIDIIEDKRQIIENNSKNSTSLKGGVYTVYKGVLENYERIKSNVIERSKKIILDEVDTESINYYLEYTQDNLNHLLPEQKELVISELTQFSHKNSIPSKNFEKLFLKLKLDVTAFDVVRVSEQKPTEREIMDENATIGIEFADATDPHDIGRIIRNVRSNAGLSQGKLVEGIDISSRTLSRIETGAGTPYLTTLKEIAKATDTDLVIGFRSKPKLDNNM